MPAKKKTVSCTDLEPFKKHAHKPSAGADRHYKGKLKAHKFKKGSEAHKAFLEGRY